MTAPKKEIHDISPEQIYGQAPQLVLYSGSQVTPSGNYRDGSLWVKNLETNTTVQLKDQTQFGPDATISGATLSANGLVAYALLSKPSDQGGHQHFIVRIDLKSGEFQTIAEDADLGVVDINETSLAASQDGSKLSFQAFSPNRQVGVYEIKVVGSNGGIGTQEMSEQIKRIAPDNNQGLMPRYDSNDQLKLTPTADAAETALSQQVVTYNLRFPLSGDGFYVPRGYGGGTTHVPAYNDQYALDFARNPRNQGDATSQCVGYDVYAAADGLVTRVNYDDESYNDGYGNYVTIEHTINGQKVKTLYAHLQQLPSGFKENVTRVTRGQYIQEMGKTGNTDGYCHLHFTYRTTGNVSLKPATPQSPMQGLGPYAAGAASGSCPITGFEGANVNTFYRYYNC